MGFPLALAIIFCLYFFSQGLTGWWIVALVVAIVIFAIIIWQHSRLAQKNIHQK